MQTMNEREIPDLVNLMEWNRFAEEKKTLLEALTILNNRHREAVSSIERERDEARKQLNRTLDELYEEQQNHGITKGHLTECRMEANDWWSSHSHVKNENKAMREAIKEAESVLKNLYSSYPVERGYVDGPCLKREDMEEVKAALAKLQPFLA